jgi:hypothetical protein
MNRKLPGPKAKVHEATENGAMFETALELSSSQRGGIKRCFVDKCSFMFRASGQGDGVFETSLQASGPIFAKDRGNNLSGMGSLINGNAIIRLTNADAKEEGCKSFVMHFSGSSFHGGKDLETNGLRHRGGDHRWRD